MRWSQCAASLQPFREVVTNIWSVVPMARTAYAFSVALDL
ncbi:MAG: hypothetical protein KatS3mg060_2766 [Dehalococcoidia bacterium]|nr:MAG: hypothetical protein KatS3mg060_2766 [Dehalococcoidia bacterium]